MPAKQRATMLTICGVGLAALILAPRGRAVGAEATLSVAGRSNAQPSIAAEGAFVAVAWAAASADGVTDIFAAVSQDAGGTFSPPHRVNDAPGEASVSGEQPPRVVLIPRAGGVPSVVIAWTAKGTGGTRLLSARSDDGAASFTRAIPVPGSEARGNRGWESVALDPAGHVVAIWLDHREAADTRASGTPMSHADGGHMGHEADGVARAQLSKLYFARLTGEANSRAVVGGVCYCCKTALAVAPDGAIVAAWRHVFPGNIRDIAVTLSRDGGRTFAPPIRVSDDQWMLDGCPENGPAMAVDRRNMIHMIWPTLVSETTGDGRQNLALFYGHSRNGGTFSPRQRIPTEGTPRHPTIAIHPDGSVLAAWDEQTNGTRRVAMSRGVRDADGMVVRFSRVPAHATSRGEYPVVAAVNDGFVVAVTSGEPAQSKILIERVASQPR